MEYKIVAEPSVIDKGTNHNPWITLYRKEGREDTMFKIPAPALVALFDVKNIEVEITVKISSKAKELLEKYEDAINGKVTDDDLGSLNFIEPELYKPLDTSS
jgi:hypothetical protein